MSFRAVVFDLDGTLLDTLEDLADSCNQVLADHGLPTHPAGAYRYFIGDGVEKLVERMLPPEHRAAEIVTDYAALVRKIYSLRWNRKMGPYDGIAEMLAQLIERGIRLAVLSNKLHSATVEVVAHFFKDVPFEQVAGARPEVPLKPDPAGALRIASQMGLRPQDFRYLGDTAVDMQTAQSAGMYAVGAAWGFRPQELESAGARLVIGHPRQILQDK